MTDSSQADAFPDRPRNIVVGQKISAKKLQRAKELRQQMTEAEKLLWHELRGNRLEGLHFRRQQIIDGFIVDFYCHACGLVVEVDGAIHQFQAEYDAERTQVLQKRGLKVLRLPNEAVMKNLPDVLMQILVECRPNPPTPFPGREGGA